MFGLSYSETADISAAGRVCQRQLSRCRLTTSVQRYGNCVIDENAEPSSHALATGLGKRPDSDATGKFEIETQKMTQLVSPNSCLRQNKMSRLRQDCALYIDRQITVPC